MYQLIVVLILIFYKCKILFSYDIYLLTCIMNGIFHSIIYNCKQTNNLLLSQMMYNCAKIKTSGKMLMFLLAVIFLTYTVIKYNIK